MLHDERAPLGDALVALRERAVRRDKFTALRDGLVALRGELVAMFQ